ncbi:hypothetical protein KFU94_02210 [Chloroflexi bacterium TSY]|nr:hypothetical protein [Chloroflexi bacterium TSY]
MTPKSLQSRLKIAKNAKFGSTEPWASCCQLVNESLVCSAYERIDAGIWPTR